MSDELVNETVDFYEGEVRRLQTKAANYDRMEIILRGYFAQHAENRDDTGCPCRWCLEARAFLSG